jgi:hypothetical protein
LTAEVGTIPELPAARGFESTTTAELRPRYEDVAQDGRVQLTTLMPGLSAVWRAFGAGSRFDDLRRQGILPILRRIVLTGEDGPFSATTPIHVEGTWRLARETNGDRIFLDMWLDAFAPIASTLGPAPPPDAERVRVGRVFAEHVVTRPFAPPNERKVTRLGVPGIPDLLEDTHPFLEAEDLIAGRDLAAAGEQVFGLMHTDSNQHVNSLVYPRVFEEAAIRQLAGRPLLARAIELRYRKPFFLGDRAAIRLAIEPTPTEKSVTVVGSFAPPTADKPSCTVAMRLA